ncbi:class I SAM-dependent methyltransferase [bacterium]|nr:class I SAM-dependent methyltransferase [bacterium]
MITEKLLRCSIKSAELEQSRINEKVMGIGGFTSNKVRHFLNNICGVLPFHYLEVGTHHGSTIIAASFRNHGKYTGIDDFSQFQGREKVLFDNINQFNGLCNIKFINGNSFSKEVIDQIDNNSIEVYFYDGDHSYESQYKALVDYIGKMNKKFCFIVDDWNWEGPRNGTNDAISFLELKTVYKEELFTPNYENGRADSWWNGLGIFILERQ